MGSYNALLSTIQCAMKIVHGNIGLIRLQTKPLYGLSQLMSWNWWNIDSQESEWQYLHAKLRFSKHWTCWAIPFLTYMKHVCCFCFVTLMCMCRGQYRVNYEKSFHKHCSKNKFGFSVRHICNVIVLVHDCISALWASRNVQGFCFCGDFSGSSN